MSCNINSREEALNKTWKKKCVCAWICVCVCVCIKVFLSQSGHIIISSLAWGIREWTTCAKAELASPDLLGSDDGRERSIPLCIKCRTICELQISTTCAAYNGWDRKSKCFGLGRKHAGITGLSTCQNPRDQPAPRRLYSQAAGREALIILLCYELNCCL